MSTKDSGPPGGLWSRVQGPPSPAPRSATSSRVPGPPGGESEHAAARCRAPEWREEGDTRQGLLFPGQPSLMASAPGGRGARTSAKKGPQTTTSLGRGRQKHGDRPGEPRAGGTWAVGQDVGESAALPPLPLSVPASGNGTVISRMTSRMGEGSSRGQGHWGHCRHFPAGQQSPGCCRTRCGAQGRHPGGVRGRGGKGDRAWVPGALEVILPRARETRATAWHGCSPSFSLRDRRSTAPPSVSGASPDETR